MRRTLIGLLFLLLAVGGLSGCGGALNIFTKSPDAALAHYGLGMTYRQSGNQYAASVEFKKAVEEDPNMYHAWYRLGLAYQALGDDKKAYWAWRQGLAQAQAGPERVDYSRVRSTNEMRAALAGLQVGQDLAGQPAPLPEPQGMDKPKIEAPSLMTKPAAKPKAAAKPKIVTPGPKKGYGVVYSTNRYERTARQDKARLAKYGWPVDITAYRDKKRRNWYRVWVGCCTGKAQAQSLLKQVKKRTGKRDAVVRKR